MNLIALLILLGSLAMASGRQNGTEAVRVKLGPALVPRLNQKLLPMAASSVSIYRLLGQGVKRRLGSTEEPSQLRNSHGQGTLAFQYQAGGNQRQEAEDSGKGSQSLALFSIVCPLFLVLIVIFWCCAHFCPQSRLYHRPI